MKRKSTLYFDINQLPTILTLREASIYLRCSEDMLKKQAQRGVFPAYKLTEDGRWYIERNDLLGYVDSCKQRRCATA